MDSIGIILLLLIVILIVIYSIKYISVKEGFKNSTSASAYKKDKAYRSQLSLLSKKYDPPSDGRKGVIELFQDSSVDMIPSQRCLVNFQCLACRFTGYLGPFNNGFFDANESVKYACKAGCRVFVLEIDYVDNQTASDGTPSYFPKLVIRDVQSRNVVNGISYQPLQNSLLKSNIRDACTAIKEYAFAPNNPNANDPVIVVLYLLRIPPSTSAAVKQNIVYMSNIAKCLQPLVDRHVDNIISGGTFTRQKQEGRLLTNPITDYQGRILIFSNADTTPFRNETSYGPKEDLDYLVNLRLTYKQTKLGATGNSTGGSFGLLETAENYTIIPTDQIDATASDTKLKWTLCLSQDPSQPVSESTYKSITEKFGVHCVPIQIWDENNGFMFADTTFKTYSFIPKPLPLRFVAPLVAVPAEPSPQTNANGGTLRQPTVGGM